MRAPSVTIAVVAMVVHATACSSGPAAPDAAAPVAREAHVIFPDAAALTWAGIVPVLLSPDTDFTPSLVSAFSLDGVAQLLPEQRGTDPVAFLLVDTRALVDGPHELAASVSVMDATYATRVHFVVANGPAGTPAFDGGLVDVTGAIPGTRRTVIDDRFAGAVPLDVDSDGTLDLFTWDRRLVQILRQVAPLTFSETRTVLPGSVRGAGVADLDGDGHPEIVAVGDGISVFRVAGDALVDVTATAGIPAWATTGQHFFGVTFADLDMDGLLDVGVAQMACGAGANAVLHNEGDLHFADIAPALGLDLPAGATYAFAMDVPDPASGLVDVWSFEEGCTPTRTSLRRYRPGDGLPVLVTEVRPPLEQVAPMGSVWIDTDLDGALDMWAAGDVVSPVWAGPDFGREVSAPSGLAGWTDATARDVSAWAMVMFDADMDGHADMYVVHDPSDPSLVDLRAPADALFWRSAPGRYRELGALAGLPGEHACRAAHGADLDDDGDVDLLLGCREGLRVLRNDLRAPGLGHTIVLRGHVSNPDGVHALLTLPSGEVQLVRGGGQPFAGGLETPSFAATGGAVSVRWPSGITQRVDVGTSPRLTIEEPDVLRVTPRRVASGALVGIEVEPGALGMPDATVDVRTTAGTWSRAPARDADGIWRGTLLAPPAPAEAVVTVRVGTIELRTRPRVFVR